VAKSPVVGGRPRVDCFFNFCSRDFNAKFQGQVVLFYLCGPICKTVSTDNSINAAIGVFPDPSLYSEKDVEV
jgi:hypothetical protein